jgi:transcriptional regulator with XRE-family HTH domain
MNHSPTSHHHQKEILMDTVLKLRELRAHAGMTQEEVARRSQLGVKTISSFESGARIESMKVSQLEAILAVYKLTLPQFFSRAIERDLAPWESESPTDTLLRRLESLPPDAQEALTEKISAMLDAAEAILPFAGSRPRTTASNAHLH